MNFLRACDRFSRAACFSERSNISVSKSSKRALVALARADAPEVNPSSAVTVDTDDNLFHFVTAIGSVATSSSRRLDN